MAAKESKKTDNVPAHVGPAIKKWREARDLTQEQLAENLGKKKGHISSIENGHGNLSLPIFMKLCKVLDVPASRLLEEPLRKGHRELDETVTALLERLGLPEMRWLASLSKADAREAMDRAHERVAFLESQRKRKSSKTA